MDKVILPSGATLEITLMPFEEAWGIFQVVSAVIEKLDINIKDLGIDISKPADLINLKGPIASLLANREITDCGKLCLKRCLYNGLRIDSQTFEKKETRSDWIAVLFYCIYCNVSPFLSNLISYLTKKLETLLAKTPQK